MSASDDLDATIEKSHRALDAFLKGDPGPLQALFSQREDVTLANPFGPAQRGWPQVRDTMARAAEHYRNGRAVGFDRISEHVTAELASIHELERFQAKVGGSEEVTAVSLRCTTVFRLEDGGWKIVHRHADPITETRPAASVIHEKESCRSKPLFLSDGGRASANGPQMPSPANPKALLLRAPALELARRLGVVGGVIGA